MGIDHVYVEHNEGHIFIDEEALEFLSDHLHFTPLKESLVSATEIDGRGDLAYFRATYRLTMSFGDAEPVTDVGKWLAILRKQPDGSWLYSAWIWNSDLPLPEGGSET